MNDNKPTENYCTKSDAKSICEYLEGMDSFVFNGSDIKYTIINSIENNYIKELYKYENGVSHFIENKTKKSEISESLSQITSTESSNSSSESDSNKTKSYKEKISSSSSIEKSSSSNSHSLSY